MNMSVLCDMRHLLFKRVSHIFCYVQIATNVDRLKKAENAKSFTVAIGTYMYVPWMVLVMTMSAVRNLVILPIA